MKAISMKVMTLKELGPEILLGHFFRHVFGVFPFHSWISFKNGLNNVRSEIIPKKKIGTSKTEIVMKNKPERVFGL